MNAPKPLVNLIVSFEKLPGVGPKTAQRLAYYLLHVPQSELDSFSEALTRLKKDTVLCSNCKNVSVHDPCEVCSDVNRDFSTILVVEQPLDILAFEKTGKYHGVYHVLHGVINPLENIGPEEIFLEQLISRIKGGDNQVHEVIIATNPTMEGEATAMYLTRRLREVFSDKLSVTRLGMGIPTGAYLEFADENTLTRAIEGRRQM